MCVCVGGWQTVSLIYEFKHLMESSSLSSLITKVLCDVGPHTWHMYVPFPVCKVRLTMFHMLKRMWSLTHK